MRKAESKIIKYNVAFNTELPNLSSRLDLATYNLNDKLFYVTI